MCITFFYCKQTKNENKQKFSNLFNHLQFFLAFNRDQQIQRETKSLNYFQQDPNILAGRDMHTKGSWLGVNIKTGIVVILTNYFQIIHRSAKSRGKVVYEILSTNFVKSHKIKQVSDVDAIIDTFLQNILSNSKQYSALNLVVYNIFTRKIHYICTQTNMKKPKQLNENQPYGLCNCQIQYLLPKTQAGLKKFRNLIENVFPLQQNEHSLFEQMQRIMKDKEQFKNSVFPQSSIFISPYFNCDYKMNRMTRTTTYICIQRDEKQINCYKLKMKQTTYDQNLSQNTKDYQLLIQLKSFQKQFLTKQTEEFYSH